MPLGEDPLWFKDAIIYQVHVKAFFDSNDDGIGDFRGLSQKLDYIAALGATCIWLLPFYPSPLRDDGYDIADYRNVNPAYGTMHDFRTFVRAAHERGIRVITELVINHTSDQHPWFQRARRAKPGTNARDFYVWSDTDQKYAGTRIIFTDTEVSNWTWDPVAGQYYWHRFFSHQPDLNFQNPRVIRAVMDVMRFWFAAGVDGMRLDAVPYLYEREGTSSENLPETHGLLKVMRAVLDAEYPDRVFLAEANQWPEDVRAYFGDGDECHMAFHFPLMPRMFMAIAEEDRYPIIDIMRQTPDIPATCQWAIFLRNHDEMTLEMVTQEERDYMYRVYASEPRARVNIGIRRRLAPLMENDRRRIELLTGLLMSMPGTPIIYYGDEIGMGDNIYLSDRDGVRTPMQWSIDRNGGFSRANPERCYLPPVMDSVYGYQSLNVEAQGKSPSSLLNWLRKLIAVRQGHRVFGRGTLTFLSPANRKVIAYLREFEGETVLCIANLAHSPQQAALDLSRFKGRIPVEMIGWSSFGTIQDDRYVITLPEHGFFWLLLSETAQPPAWEVPLPDELPELITLVLPREAGNDPVSAKAISLLEKDVLPLYFPKQPWFAPKEAIEGVHFVDTVSLGSDPHPTYLSLFDVTLEGGEKVSYFVPLVVAYESDEARAKGMTRATLARVRRGARAGFLYDAFATDTFALSVLDDVRESRSRQSVQGGEYAATGTAALGILPRVETSTVRRLQGNAAVVVDEQIMLKGFRAAYPGPQPEVEVARFLAAAEFRNTPELFGWVEYRRPGAEPMALCLLKHFVESQGDMWATTLAYLERFFDRRRSLDEQGDEHTLFAERMVRLGERLAELHRAFATPLGDPAFEPEPVTQRDLDRWVAEARATAESALAQLEREFARVPAEYHERARFLLDRKGDILARVAVPILGDATFTKTRLHGDFHLGKVLGLPEDFCIIGFDGPAGRSLAERRQKSAPLHDVANMLRSFNYAAVASMRGLATDRPQDSSALEPAARDWERQTAEAFLEGYRAAIGDCSSYPGESALTRALLDLFVLEKAFYEIKFELANRPPWLRIPFQGIYDILGTSAEPVAYATVPG